MKACGEIGREADASRRRDQPVFAELMVEPVPRTGAAIVNVEVVDRIAQAQIEGLTLVSNEKLFDAFGVERLW